MERCSGTQKEAGAGGGSEECFSLHKAKEHSDAKYIKQRKRIGVAWVETAVADAPETHETIRRF